MHARSPFTLASSLVLALAFPGTLAAQNAHEALTVEPPSAAPARSAPPLTGRYRFVSGRDAVRRAVDGVCDRLDFFTRAFARPILEDRNQPYDAVSLAFEDDVVSFSLGAWGPVRTRQGATRTIRNERGEAVRVHQVLRDGRLVQTLATDQGTRRNVIQASPDGRVLTIDTVITSPRLPAPLRYRLVYHREAGAQSR
ncbi:MAG: hypothetical protein KF729_09450 [Sandaracinaceae bacterium]|nr:hypothetical protein [Sandaracinaceae bacterium]